MPAPNATKGLAPLRSGKNENFSDFLYTAPENMIHK